MTRRLLAGLVGLIAVILVAGWFLFVAAPRFFRDAPAGSATPTDTTAQAPAQRRITATLFYVADDGMSLVPVRREVPFAEPVVEQARQIIEAQLGDPGEGQVSAIAPGTTLRAIFLSDGGQLFVDLAGTAATAPTGGSLDELLAVYTIVNAATVNLPAVTHVQILLDGKEVDTFAGHVDLRNPLSRNMSLVKTDTP